MCYLFFSNFFLGNAEQPFAMSHPEEKKHKNKGKPSSDFLV